MKKLQNLDELKKICNFEKGIGIESRNLCKQFNDKKAFAIPILTASAFII